MKAAVLLALLTLPAAAQRQPADLVHPLVGTQSEGQTYPATGVPFAMAHYTPQTRAGEIKCVAPYYFTDPKIQGFRATHFLSGSCVPDYGSVTLMPSIGPLKTNAVERASTFDRSTEHASPYLYQVTLDQAGVKAELTGLSRAGIMRFTATHPGEASIVIENNARAGEGFVRIDAKMQQITGEVPVRREYAGSGQPAGFSSFFVIEFSKPFTTFGTWAGPAQTDGSTSQQGDGLPPAVIKPPPTAFVGAGGSTLPTASNRPGFGAYVGFGPEQAGDIVVARIGTSFTSLEEARKNLTAEIPNPDFDLIKSKAQAEWNHALGLVRVKDDIPATTVFYTALYHAFLHPRTYSDVDGSYPRFSSDHRIEQANGFTYYDDFSMWDIFRAQLPLLTILDPKRDVDFVQSLIAKGEQGGGYLPIFPAWNSYTSEMVGDHASVAIIDAYMKHLPGFDPARAYALMRRTATDLPPRPDYLNGIGRRGLVSYQKYGYIPLEDHIDDAFHKNEQVSRTLEYAYDDAILARFAAALGKSEDAALFAKRGQDWRNVVNPTTGFATGRKTDGTWTNPMDPAVKYTWITEGTPWVYTFFVPQDIPALITLEGGPRAFEAKLDGLFTGGFYDHGNEPSHHIEYLYDAAGAPAKTQQHVRDSMETQYKDGPDGLAGNDDAGQMSAWYVLSALGFYQVTPGIPEYWLGSPRFDDVTVTLPNGKTLRILAKGAGSGRVYVRRVLLNGKPLHAYKIQHTQIAAGGTLTFQMSSTPSAP